ncbi:MAG: glycosyltransferase, partial [Bacteroidetes bacterium]
NNLAADIDWVISILKKSRQTVNTQLIVAEYLVGGLSRKRHRQSLKDRFAVMRRHYGLPATLWAHFLILLRSFFQNEAVA